MAPPNNVKSVQFTYKKVKPITRSRQGRGFRSSLISGKARVNRERDIGEKGLPA
jgi:hypothetical protein